ncbi:uncharacterized protein LOC126691201 [Quercus robur]|uniref:uncharacterized protein LOC126691201 n=1 Tax=Quercus robur TaxID=38942 RepID=UPI002163AF5D|nr:uncharacterized protein LOC126691201 [Quercus robur]
MVDGWTDTRHRTLINFLVYCPKGIIFICFVDASNLVKDAITLSNLFDEFVNWVGPANIVHLVTNIAANFVAVGRILCGKYRNISWSSCAVHCLNLILKDIGKMDHVDKLAKRASKTTVFIYNHVALQAWLRTRKNWTEIVRPGPTRFSTTFIAIGSLKEHKHDLQALVTSKFYVESRYAKDKKAKAMLKIILDNQFWNDCPVIVHIVSPLIHLLCIVDSDEKPTMGFVYDGKKKFNFDPIDYASIDKTEFWVVEDEEPPYLNHEEIENALYKEAAYPIEEESSSQLIKDDDDINLESFGDELDAPPGFRDKNHPIQVEDEDEDEDDDNDANGGVFGSHDDIDFNFLHDK